MSRTTLLIPIIIALCLISVSCAGLPAAKTAVINFKQSMEARDYERAKKNASEAFAKKIDGYKQIEAIGSSGNPSPSDFQSIAGKDGVMSLAFDASTLSGLTFASTNMPTIHYVPDLLKGTVVKDTARIWHIDEDYIVYVLIKEKGRWVLNGFDISKLSDQSSQPSAK